MKEKDFCLLVLYFVHEKNFTNKCGLVKASGGVFCSNEYENNNSEDSETPLKKSGEDRHSKKECFGRIASFQV